MRERARERGVKVAFTLAEVLITLGIIGVVAALTMPSLIVNYQKQQTIVKLKSFYSTMSQAFRLSTIKNGSYDQWESNFFGETTSLNGDGNKQLKWLEKYLLPYIKYTETDTKGKYALVALPNGSGFSNYNNMYFFCLKYADCKAVTESYNSRTRFIFKIGGSGFRTYDCGWLGTREELFKTNTCSHKCPGAMCAKLLEYDGWRMLEDYPW